MLVRSVFALVGRWGVVSAPRALAAGLACGRSPARRRSQFRVGFETSKYMSARAPRVRDVLSEEEPLGALRCLRGARQGYDKGVKAHCVPCHTCKDLSKEVKAHLERNAEATYGKVYIKRGGRYNYLTARLAGNLYG